MRADVAAGVPISAEEVAIKNRCCMAPIAFRSLAAVPFPRQAETIMAQVMAKTV